MRDSHAIPIQPEGQRDADRKAAGVSNSVRRALSILGLLNRSAQALSFSDIKTALDLPKSTTSLLLATLEALGYVTRERDNRRYRLNPQVCRSGFVPMNHLDLTEVAIPVLKSVSSTISLTSFVSVLDGDQVLFVVKADGPHPTCCDVYPGRKANAQCTAVGKVLLAWMNKEEQRDFLSRHHVIPHTDRTITSKDALLEELRRVRQVGYAIDDQEEALSIRCLAVPVITEESPGTVALGITGSVTEIHSNNIASLIQYLKQMAQRIKRPGESACGRGATPDFVRNSGLLTYQ